MNTRNRTIDTAKAILILLMAFGHTILMVGVTNTPGIYSALNTLIYSFHMPAFFIISGMLFNYEKWKSKTLSFYVVSKFKQVIIPYFFFEILSATIKRFFNWGTYDTLSSTIRNILTVRCYVPADWFLVVYFFASVLFFILVRHVSKRRLGILGIISVLLIGLCPQNDITMRFFRILLAASCISIGYIGRDFFLQKYPPYTFYLHVFSPYLHLL